MCMAKYGKSDQASQISDHCALLAKKYYLCDAFIIVIIMIKAYIWEIA